MGITGVNFATPEGTLVLLENESNLRFTATLPKVHLALMGLEKIIPRLADLEVMLRLLPASATGQRLTALVHFIQGLKVQPQGNQVFYLVILDNGRRRLAADPELAEALYCLRCGACLNVCPIFQVGAAHLYGRVYPGAIGILLAPYLAPVGDICDLCTQCGACQEICPVGIRLADKIRGLRRHSRRFRPAPGLDAPWPGRCSAGPAGTGAWSRPRGGWPDWRPAGLGPSRAAGLGPGELPSATTGRRPETLLGEEDQERLPLPPCQAPPVPRTWTELKPDKLAAKENLDLDSATAPVGKTASRSRQFTYRGEGSGRPGPAAGRRRQPLWLEDHPWLRQVAGELEKLGVKHRIAQADWTPEAGTAVTVGLGAIPETGSVLVDSGAGPGAVLAFRAKSRSS